MKRFYTVKEAADILGFSTNTVYKYLDEEKIKGKRIGKGRFRIPYGELAPYMGIEERINHAISPKPLAKKISEAILKAEDNFNGTAPNNCDAIFFKLFIGLVFAGQGILWLVTRGIPGLVPYAFVLLGISIIFAAILCRKLKRQHFFILNLLTFTLLVYSSYLMIAAQRYGTFVFLASIFFVLLSFEIIARKKELTFFRSFVLLWMILMFLTGIMSLISPANSPLFYLFDHVSYNKTLFAIVWFGFLTTPSIFLLTPIGEKSKLDGIILPLAGIFSFLSSFALSVKGDWDNSYFALLFSIFTFFLFWWRRTEIKLIGRTLHTIILTLIWLATFAVISFSMVFGTQEKIKAVKIIPLQNNVSAVADELNIYFGNVQSQLISASAGENVSSVILRGDPEAAIETVKNIYQTIPNLRRILLLDKDGIALGAYPRNSLLQGTNFASRDYFRKTKILLRGYISSVFESVLNTQIVAVTGPVFSNNQFVGELMVAVDLEDLSAKHNSMEAFGKIIAYDENSKFALNPDFGKIGKDAPKEIVDRKPAENVLRVYAFANVPRWMVVEEVNTLTVLDGISNINIVIFVLIAVNSIFSMTVTLVLLRRRGR